MNRNIRTICIFAAGVILLQQAIAFGFTHSEQMGRQRQVMDENNIDPAALFYTESPLALAAEKKLRRRLARMEYTSAVN